MKKIFFLILLCVGMSAHSFGGALSGITSPPAGGENAWVIAPIGAAEFNPSSSNNYGLAISEAIGYANLLPGADSSHVVVSPYAFVGPFLAANIGQWVATNGGAQISFDYGLMIGLPKLDATLPEVAFSATWNTVNHQGCKLLIDVAFPADILSDILVHKL
jgi:hypothetical protein